VNDNAKGPAKSAGAQLRRYGEQALREDVQGLLTEWAEEVQDSERIFFRASVSNRKMFWDWENSPIKKGEFPSQKTHNKSSSCLFRGQPTAHVPIPDQTTCTYLC
jgi:hypothetical protein